MKTYTHEQLLTILDIQHELDLIEHNRLVNGKAGDIHAYEGVNAHFESCKKNGFTDLDCDQLYFLIDFYKSSI